MSINEDTVKKSNGKWVNRGDTGEEHGEFKTKKAADAQRRAIFASGWKGESLKEDKYDYDETSTKDQDLWDTLSMEVADSLNHIFGIDNLGGKFEQDAIKAVDHLVRIVKMHNDGIVGESLKEDFDGEVKNWNNAYAFFCDIVDKYFDGTPESIEKVNDEVTKLYLEHQGEEPFETAWKKWNDPYDGLDESLLKESLPKELEELFDGESYVVGWFDEDHKLYDSSTFDTEDEAEDEAVDTLYELDDEDYTAELYDIDGSLICTYDYSDARRYVGDIDELENHGWDDLI